MLDLRGGLVVEDAGERLAELRLGGGVGHLVVGRGVDGQPADEPQLGGLAPVLGRVVLIEHAVSAVGVRHGPLEVIERLVAAADLLDLDLEVTDDEYNVPVLAAQLQRLVFLGLHMHACASKIISTS